MMKLFIIICSISMSLMVHAQKNTKPEAAVPKIGAYPDKDAVVYKNALSMGDLETASNALHNIIAANPNGGIYKDTLALVYLERGYFRQAQMLTKMLYQEKENDLRAEILGVCAKQLNQPTEAIDYYKKLYTSTKKINFLFEQLLLEYTIKRLEEAKLSAISLLTLITDDDKTVLNVPKLDNKTEQQIALKAGVHYILGNIYLDRNNTPLAKEQYEKAIALQPDYEVAQNALKLLVNKK